MARWQESPVVGSQPKWASSPAVGETVPDVTTMDDSQFPEALREDSDKIRNAVVYARNLGITGQQAYDYETQINESLYGNGTTSSAAWKLTRNKIGQSRRKSFVDAIGHGAMNTYQNTQKFVAGMGRMVTETLGGSWKGFSGFGLADPAFRWMFGVPRDADLAQTMADLSNAVSQDIKDSQIEHPEMGYAIDSDAGFVETLKQMVTRPENMAQGFVESVSMLLEGALGTMVAGPVGGGVAMAIPRSGEVYQNARASGTGVLPAFAQAIATSSIEAAIEEWTLGKKITLGKNINRVLQGGPGRKLLWEGMKAEFRGSAEEGSQQFNENFWRWMFTDRSQKWFDGVQQATAMGGPLEVAMSGGFAAAGKVGSPVSVDEAYRRLDVIRTGLNESDLSVTDKQDIRAEIDKAPQTVPDIFGIEETADGNTAERAPASKPTVQTSGAGEVAADLAARTQETEAGSGQAQELWRRLSDPAGFTASGEDETAISELYSEGLIDSPAIIDEVLRPGTMSRVPPEALAPDARGTGARIEDLLGYMSPEGRDALNSRERADLKAAYLSPRARVIYQSPDIALDKLTGGDAITFEEVAGLHWYLADLRARKDSMQQQVAVARDDVEKMSFQEQADRAQDRIDDVALQIGLSNSNWGRYGRLIQAILNENMDPTWMRDRMTRSKKAPLNDKDNAYVDKVAAADAKLKEEIDRLRVENDKLTAELAAKKGSSRRKTEPKSSRDERLANNMAKLKQLLEAGC